jgi:hypothetical protein
MNDIQDDAPQVRRRRYNRLAAASAVTAVAGAGVLLFAVNTTVSNAAPADKYFVCKFVGTPGDGETLQTGNNPISVSGNALPDGVTVGSFFPDAQGRSFVIAIDNTGNGGGQSGEPTAEDCLAVIQPPPPTTSTAVTSSSAGTEPSSSSNPPPVTTVTETAGAEPTSEVIPAGVAAGSHTTSNSETTAIGAVLMALGLGGLLTAVRPWKRGSH